MQTRQRALRTPPRSFRRRSGPTSSSRFPAGRRGSSSRPGPPRSPGGAPSPRPGSAPGRRTRRASGAVGGARAAPLPASAPGQRRRRDRSSPGSMLPPCRVASFRPRRTDSLRDEVTQLLRRLIRLDTVNPPGNETAAAELLRDYLAESGVESELYAKVPERANLVARLPGRGEGPSLLFLSHTDTVLADPSEWRVDPWSGELRDGEVWGRGALDMKGEVAVSAVTIASLAREGFEPAGDLIFVAAADEEVGQGHGLPWLCENRPDAVHADYALNEGAGERIELAGRGFYVCSTAEKMRSPFRLRAHGRAGHDSMPGIADNALVKAAGLIERLTAYKPPLQM